MDTKIVSSKMSSPIFQYDLHTKLYVNVLDGISDTDAHKRLETKANHIAWIAGSMVSARCWIGFAAGIEVKSAYDDLFSDPKTGMKPIQEGFTYPSLEEYKKEWERITPAVSEKLSSLSDEKLNEPEPFGMGENLTIFDSINYMIDRESYCIGQIGLWRRLLGYEAMKYN